MGIFGCWAHLCHAMTRCLTRNVSTVVWTPISPLYTSEWPFDQRLCYFPKDDFFGTPCSFCIYPILVFYQPTSLKGLEVGKADQVAGRPIWWLIGRLANMYDNRDSNWLILDRQMLMIDSRITFAKLSYYEIWFHEFWELMLLNSSKIRF